MRQATLGLSLLQVKIALKTNSLKMESTRAQAKAHRKALILDHAREIIVKDGFDALKIRDLATRADLTVPTIYNLIGGKQEILAQIIEGLVEKLRQVQAETVGGDEPFVALIDQLTELFASDESYYRAAFIAGDRSGLFEQRSSDGFFAQSVELPIQACREAKQAGLLLGEVTAEQLGEQIYGCYRLARQDWTLGYIDLDEFSRRALIGIFLCLAADATESYRQQLFRRIADLR